MWKITTRGGPLFDGSVHQHYTRIVNETARIPPHPPHVQRSLQQELAALNTFTNNLDNFLQDTNIADPTQVLHRAYNPGLGVAIPNTYLLSDGDWEAYFRLDHGTQTATGIYVRNIRDPIATSLMSILASI